MLAKHLAKMKFHYHSLYKIQINVIYHMEPTSSTDSYAQMIPKEVIMFERTAKAIPPLVLRKSSQKKTRR